MVSERVKLELAKIYFVTSAVILYPFSFFRCTILVESMVCLLQFIAIDLYRNERFVNIICLPHK